MLFNLCYRESFVTVLQIKSINSFFEWLNQSAILQLFPEYDEQGEQLHWRERQFIYGGASLRLGPPRLRQLRVKKGM